MSIQAIRAKRDEAIAQEQRTLTNLVKELNIALDSYEADKGQVSIIGTFLKNGLTAYRQRAINELRAILKESEDKSALVDVYTIRKNFSARLKQEDLSVFGLSGLADRVLQVLQRPEFSYHTLHQLRETSHQASLAYEKYRQLQQTSTGQTAIEESELLKDQQSHIDVLSILHTVSSLTTETTQHELAQERQKNQQLEGRVERIEVLLNTIVEQNAQLQLSVSNLRDENKKLKAENTSYKRQLLEHRHSAYPGVLWSPSQVSINASDTSCDFPFSSDKYTVRNEI